MRVMGKLGVKAFIGILILTFSLSLVCTGGDGWAQIISIAKKKAGGGGEACNTTTAYVSNTSTATANLVYHTHNYNYYAGTTYTPAENISVCQIDIYIDYTAGNISGKTYTVTIWSLSSGNLDTLLGTSGGVTGNNSWSSSWPSFSFASPVSLSSGTAYGIAVAVTGAVDFSNYASGGSNGESVFTGEEMNWLSSGEADNPTGANEMMVKIYRME